MLHSHTTEVDASEFHEWVTSSEFLEPLGGRLERLGCGDMLSKQLRASAGAPGWQDIAQLDAATRMVSEIVRSGGLRRGREAAAAISAHLGGSSKVPPIPPSYWMAKPGEHGVLLRGAVLVRAKARAEGGNPNPAANPPVPIEVEAALREAPERPAQHLIRLAVEAGRALPAALLLTLVLGVLASVLEGGLFRGALDIGTTLGSPRQRIFALSALWVCVVAQLWLKVAGGSVAFRIGRWLESRLRVAFLEKLPRLGDRYLRSRPLSDMAQRSHLTYLLRQFPMVLSRIGFAAISLGATSGALIWLAPRSALWVVLLSMLAVLLPLSAQPFLIEADLRVRTHAGALSRFYLDALLGLLPIRACGGEAALLREHESILIQWVKSGRSSVRAALYLEFS
jgi:ATP-binding cassette subfamily B protein